MRYSQSEKMQIIRLVEESPVSVKQTLLELNINRSTFYKWYRRYQQGGFDALANRYRPPKQFWNAIPPWEKRRVVEIDLEHPEKSPRELAWYITDTRGYYNNDRYHEALQNLTPADVYYGRDRDILARRKRIKKNTMLQRRRYNYSLKVA